MPARTLLRTLIEISSGVSCLDDPGHLQRPAVDRAQTVDPLHELGQRVLVGALVAADQHVLVELVLEVGQQRGADGVKGRDDAHPVGHHLLGLLGGRALPDPERAGRLAADGGGERNGGVDHQLAFAPAPA